MQNLQKSRAWFLYNSRIYTPIQLKFGVYRVNITSYKQAKINLSSLVIRQLMYRDSFYNYFMRFQIYLKHKKKYLISQAKVS